MVKIVSFSEHFGSKFEPLEHFDFLRLAARVRDQWHLQSIADLNSMKIRLAVVDGAWPSKKKAGSDQLFFCLDGEFELRTEEKTISLQPYQGAVIPAGKEFIPAARARSIVLVIE